ncbi:Heat-labile A chain [Cordyceps militaris]|uniref:Heat-labile A chain n=1 Tax=Cordyceps militaris TaxID=73501 RepID=A0A2H4SFI2_CORMI|nr:Heat-labile A chain [Cordyceps militaris]
MFILQRAFLLGLAAASLVTSRATGNAPDHGHILSRGVPEPQGDLRVPPDIPLEGQTWTRAEILAAIKTPVNPPKPFGNRGVESQIRGKFRAIVTANKNFVGITEHAADNNVKAIWDVKALAAQGKWIKLGVSGEKVTGTNGLHFARKDIAAAMQSSAKDKVTVGGKSWWKSKISPAGGASKDVFNVVYEGNEFKHIEDATGAKVFEKQGPICRRDGTKRDCSGEDVGESEVKDTVANPEGEDSPANSGKDSEEAPGAEAEASPAEPGQEVEGPANTAGEKPAGPEVEGGAVSPESPESVELAEKFSEEEFVNLATTRGMVKSLTETLSLSIKDIRTKSLGYKPLTPQSSSFKLRPGKAIAGAAGVVSVVLWVNGMVDAFTHDTNDLDKAAAVTSIVPFVGCTTNLAAEAWKGGVDSQDTALCYIGDGLLLTPLAPIGIAVHIVRWFISLNKAPKVPEKEVFLQHRDSQWEKFLDEHVYTYLYSDNKEASNSKEKSFRVKLNSSLAIQGLAVISEGAQKIGAAKVLAQNAAKASTDATEKAAIEKGSLEAVESIRAAVWNETIIRQRAYLLEMPDSLREKAKSSLKPLGEEFNKDYIANTTSISMATHYFEANLSPTNPAAAAAGVPIPDTSPGNLALVEAQLKSIGAHLQTQPLPLPKLFTLGYILGQSKGLDGLDPRVLSPRDYLRATTKLSEDRINFFSLYHTLEVAKLLQGSIKEDELRNPWKSDIPDARPLHLLIAMKFGRVSEERRGSGAASGPDFPPLKEGTLDTTASFAAVTGLSDEEVEKLPKEGEFQRYKDLVSEDKILAMLRLIQERRAQSAAKLEQTAGKDEV